MMAWREGIWSWSCPVYDTSFVLLRCPVARIPELLRAELPDAKVASEILTAGYDGMRDSVEARCTSTWTEKYRTIVTIWLRPSPTVGPAVLVHEIIHVLTTVLAKRGVLLSDDSDEAFAYYAEWLMREALTCLTGVAAA